MGTKFFPEECTALPSIETGVRHSNTRKEISAFNCTKDNALYMTTVSTYKCRT